jgi:zinc-ribbon domain
VKVAVFVIGLLLLFIGLIGAAYGWFVAAGLETTYAFTCGTGGPEPYPGFCAALLSSASGYRTLAYAMVALFGIGVAVSVAGGILEDAPPAPTMMMAPPPIPPPGADAFRTCKNCGRSMPTTDRFCPSCGTAQW